MPGFKSFLPIFLTIIAALTQHSAYSNTVSPLITSSVKLRVDASGGHSWGTGTIIDTRQGEALVLTCGHIFRDSRGKGNIEVHLFSDHSTVCVSGRCLYYDADEIDLALVIIEPPCPVRAVALVPADYQIQPLQQALSVGCDHGGNPTVRTHQIMSIDRVSTPQEFKIPFHYIQVSGAPVGGRSGGGLFSADGFLIGVCNTADPVVNDGHFVPPHMIRHILDEMNLAVVYTQPSLGTPEDLLPVQSNQQLAALTPLAPVNVPVAPPMPISAQPEPIVAQNKSAINAEEQATLEEIKRRKQDGDEVILIVRSRRNPEIPSDVIVLNGTSEQFLDALVNSPAAPAEPAYNPVIFSSHEPKQTDRQAVSYPVKY